MAAKDLPREVHQEEDVTEEHSFDELTRALASGTVSRRRALKLVGAFLIGGVVDSIPGLAWADHKPGHGMPPGQAKKDPEFSTTSFHDCTQLSISERPCYDCYYINFNQYME